MIWAREETLPRSEIEALQLERLKHQIAVSYARVPLYRQKMMAAGLRPADLRSLADLAKFPFTVKNDFRETYPFGLFAVPRDQLVRIHASSGTTGKPTVVGYTQTDMENWTETVTRMACMGGAKPDDVAQICFGYGMFTGALGLHFGLEHLGCSVIPSSVGQSARQMMYMRDFGTTLLVATPSYALHLAEMIRENGTDPATGLNLRIGLVGGEGMSETIRQELGELWGKQVLFTQNYGMSELNGPGVSGECEELCGMHINEDHFLAEIIDPETEEVLPYGSPGELVITCLTKEALPLIRYRTKDLTHLMPEPCACGRTTLRMAALSGRSDDMLIIRGVNVFPSQIEEVLGQIDSIGVNYEIKLETKNHLDVMTIAVELVDHTLLDSHKQLELLQNHIRQRIKAALGVDAFIHLAAPKTLQRFEGKARRVNDLRLK